MDFEKKIITKKPEETARVGEALARYLVSRESPRILCLYGQLGSGKTTFAQGFARGLGITTRLLSPTFIIVRRYQIPKKENYLYHVDLYRLQKTPEIEGIGLSEIFADSASYTVIEWAGRLGELLPEHRIDVFFEVDSRQRHHIYVKVST